MDGVDTLLQGVALLGPEQGCLQAALFASPMFWQHPRDEFFCPTPLLLKVAPAAKEILATQPVQQNLAWCIHLQQPKDFANLTCLVLRGGIKDF